MFIERIMMKCNCRHCANHAGFFCTLCASGTRSISEKTGTIGTSLYDAETRGPSTTTITTSPPMATAVANNIVCVTFRVM